ncbi:unnamed protein product, partial [Polarella glacialis]
ASLGCTAPRGSPRSGPQGRAGSLLLRLLDLPAPPPDTVGGHIPNSHKLWQDVHQVVQDSAGSAEVVMRRQASVEVYKRVGEVQLPP